MKKTITVLIGNSDDKLTQKQWHEFVAQMSYAIEREASKIHFAGGSVSHAEWQNFCWVIEIESVQILASKIEFLREHFHQDSIAYVVGETKFFRKDSKI